MYWRMPRWIDKRMNWDLSEITHSSMLGWTDGQVKDIRSIFSSFWTKKQKNAWIVYCCLHMFTRGGRILNAFKVYFLSFGIRGYASIRLVYILISKLISCCALGSYYSKRSVEILYPQYVNIFVCRTSIKEIVLSFIFFPTFYIFRFLLIIFCFFFFNMLFVLFPFFISTPVWHVHCIALIIPLAISTIYIQNILFLFKKKKKGKKRLSFFKFVLESSLYFDIFSFHNFFSFFFNIFKYQSNKDSVIIRQWRIFYLF